MKKYIALIFSIIFIGWSDKHEIDSDFKVFESMRSGYRLIEYISSSKSLALNNKILNNLEKEFISIGAIKVNKEQVPIANKLLPNTTNSHYYSSSSNKEHILIEYFKAESKLLNRWTQVSLSLIHI